METVVYLMRHSIVDKNNFVKNCDKTLENKSIGLSDEGICNAHKLSLELGNFDRVYSSSYKRSYDTAHEFSSNVIISSKFDERSAINIDNNISLGEYFRMQCLDYNYSFLGSENRLDISKRMLDGLLDSINRDKNGKILIVTHGCSMSFLLIELGVMDVIDYNKKIRRVVFNNKIIFEGVINYLDYFKIIFDEYNQIKDINYCKYVK